VGRVIGILGGTFDPPHIGHLVIADQACAQLGLEQVWFAPVGQPPHKSGRQVSPAEHRVAMTRLAIGNHPRFEVCLADVERPGPQYSYALMEILAGQYPGTEWRFLMGADALMDVPKWREPARLLAVARLAVARRPGRRIDLRKLEAALPGIGARIDWVDAPLVDLSSTDLRRRAREGWPLRYMVPDAVAAHIAAHGLYRS
jgi:nicotinate-nucleotide adenylyltransferase